jgi:hypothetical protein
VTITGTLFESLASVTIGGIAPTGISIAPTEITASTPALSPGTLNDVIVTNVDKTIGSIRGGFLADFLDVPQGDGFHDYVEAVFRNGITAGCGGGYCRDNPVTRAWRLPAEAGTGRPSSTGLHRCFPRRVSLASPTGSTPPPRSRAV